MVQRGVVYMIWGERAEPMCQRSIESVKRHHPELPIHVERLGSGGNWLEKPRVFDVSPFETTLYLDADTVVMERLDFAFEKAERHTLALAICECPWARRYPSIDGDIVEYNSGVIFFSKAAGALFDRWKQLVKTIDSSIRFIRDGKEQKLPNADQGGLAKAMQELSYLPFVLPLNWNFRPEYHRLLYGPVKIWHDSRDVPAAFYEWNKSQGPNERLLRYVHIDQK